jgi:hypothetical protein
MTLAAKLLGYLFQLQFLQGYRTLVAAAGALGGAVYFAANKEYEKAVASLVAFVGLIGLRTPPTPPADPPVPLTPAAPRLTVFSRPAAAVALTVGVAAAAAAGDPLPAGAFTPTQKPLSPDGVRATVDLPRERHVQNIGGSDGAGLCVYTSVQHAADWQDLPLFLDFQRWAGRRPGGSYPDKLDGDIALYCRERSQNAPGYVQHTGGDEAFLDLCLKTGRTAGVTYAGNDGFYGETIAHMVNLVHLDKDRAAVVDNNRPGRWVWMTRPEFLERWRGVYANGRPMTVRDGFRSVPVGGGWAFVWLNGPPPPYPTAPEGVTAAPPADGPNFGIKLTQMPNRPAPEKAPAGTNFGIDTRQLSTAGRKYSVNGLGVSQAAAEAILADDSTLYSLAVVGTADFQARARDAIAQLPEAVRGRLRLSDYTPDQWPVKQFSLAEGVSVRKPTLNRVGATVGAAPPTADAAAVKAAVLTALKAPVPPVDPPKPDPAPGRRIQLRPGDVVPPGVTVLIDVAGDPAPAPLPAPKAEAQPPTDDERYARIVSEVRAGKTVRIAVGHPPGTEYVRETFPSGYKALHDGVYDCFLRDGTPHMLGRPDRTPMPQPLQPPAFPAPVFAPLPPPLGGCPGGRCPGR